MKVPEWTDSKAIFEWTLAQLRPQQGPSRPPKEPSQYQYMIDVLRACESKDENGFVKLMKDARAARLVFSLLDAEDQPRRVRKPRRTNAAALGSNFVDIINDLWDEHYGKHQRRRDNPPHATEIAARLMCETGWPVTAKQLRDYREKHGAP
jgi:hypothetical protein